MLLCSCDRRHTSRSPLKIVDLLEFHKTLQCSCCRRSDNIPLPSMPDTSIMLRLKCKGWSSQVK
ncbi:hypothetical protein RchiOBHm_Chr6g0290011 [Rosa chinensis]|uniref:Uncharacterized protein n=1 Tax=Rosa chinensis TaxID=74649 RepID=A0A2P6PVQ3_ROSCH|nr:hypothetical protein RchiOBHm_Chr6g0290011 [Rosa chinensis]